MHTKKKKEMHWAHPRRIFSTKNEKKMEGSGQEEDEDRSGCIGCWQVFIESIMRRPSSERSGDFGLLNLPGKQRIGRRTNKLSHRVDDGKEEQNITGKHLTQNSVIDIEVK